MKTIVFAGSTRSGSFNRLLAGEAARMAQSLGADVTLLELADFDVPIYNADLEAQGTPADVLRLKAILRDHPAWVLCCPEYNGSMTALLKNTIDWASSPVKGDPVWSDGSLSFRGKVVGLLSASPGAFGGLRGLGQVAPLLNALGAWVCPTQHALGRAHEAFDETGRLKPEAAQRSVQAVVAQTLWAAGRLAG